MQRYKIKIEYDGTPFVGWQFQKNGLSVQEVLQKAVFNLFKEKVVVTGAGRTENGALFSYQADWAAPGRWGVEILTDKHRLIFRPLEKLQIQEIGSFCSKFYEIDDELDKVYKPGLYRQVQKFLTNKNDGMCSINEHVSNLSVYDKIISGKNNFP